MSVFKRIPRITLLKLHGTPIRLDATFVIIPLFLIDFYSSKPSDDYWFLVVVGSLGLLLSILLHELGHALVGEHFGLKTSEIGIGGLFGYAQINLKRSPRKHIIPILLAGPTANLFLFVGFWIATGVLPYDELVSMSRSPTGFLSPGWLVHVLSFLAIINIFLFVTNLLPAYPLDGGKVFALMLSFILPIQVAYLLTCIVGLVVATGLYVLLAGSSMIVAIICAWIFWINLRGFISSVRQRKSNRQRTG
jgi:Zn-dependent protease